MTLLAFWMSYRKYLAGAVVLAALVGGLFAYRIHLINLGDTRGAARVQALWDADEVKEEDLARAQRMQFATDEAAAVARNLEIARAHKAQLLAAAADIDHVTRLLQQARAAARSSAAEETGHLPGAADAGADGGAGQADADVGIDQQIARVIAERRANDSQLNALIAEIVPQMQDPPAAVAQ